MRTRIACTLSALLLSTGVGYTVHAYDVRQADKGTVATYNDGFADGVCTGSVTIAARDYKLTCKR